MDTKLSSLLLFIAFAFALLCSANFKSPALYKFPRRTAGALIIRNVASRKFWIMDWSDHRAAPPNGSHRAKCESHDLSPAAVSPRLGLRLDPPRPFPPFGVRDLTLCLSNNRIRGCHRGPAHHDRCGPRVQPKSRRKSSQPRTRTWAASRMRTRSSPRPRRSA